MTRGTSLGRPILEERSTQGRFYKLSPVDKTVGMRTHSNPFSAMRQMRFSPFAGLVLDAAGNIYGTTLSGGTFRLAGPSSNL